MKIKPTILTTFLFGIAFLAKAQDPQFIQFYNAPLQLNPAMTGVHPGKWRFVANYREQWNSILDYRPFRSMSASYDARVGMGSGGDFLAFGITALRDEAGKSNYLRMASELSVSYLKQLDGSRYRDYDQYLIGGLQAGIGQHSLDFQKLWFSAQFDPTLEQVDRTLPNGESIEDKSGVYANINAGLMWYAVMEENKSIYVGGALHHVNKPKVSFIDEDGEESLATKWAAHAGAELPLSKQFSLLPAVVVIGQGAQLLSLYGLNFRFSNHDWKELAIRAGIWGHLTKDLNNSISTPAVTFTTILELERWNIGLSYDVNANKLAAPTNGRGAFEVSLIYYHPASRKERVNCPKF